MSEDHPSSQVTAQSLLEEALRLSNLSNIASNGIIDFNSSTANLSNPSLNDVQTPRVDRASPSLARLQQSTVRRLPDHPLLARLRDIEKSIQELKDVNTEIKAENENLKIELEESWEYIASVEKDLNYLQQYSRRENVEISGLPDTVDDNDLESTIIGILRRIGVYGLEEWEISGCHRLKKRKNDRYANVIIKFVNRKRKHQCISSRKYIKDTIWEFPNLYIHENLCPRYRSIFEECEKLKKEGKIKKMWTFNGIVNIKKSDNSYERPKKIFHDNDLEKLFPNSWD